MNAFVEDILNHPLILSLLFISETPYAGSEFESSMPKYEINSHVEYLFVLKNTQWLFINDDNQCFGLIDKFVITIDEEGGISYFCHGFENLVPIFSKNKMQVISMTNYAFWKDIKYSDVLNEYHLLLKKHHLKPRIKFNEEEFINYVKKHAH